MMPATAALEPSASRWSEADASVETRVRVANKAFLQVHILYWGVCHTDSAIAGDEIVGRVEQVGDHVVIFTHSPHKVRQALSPGPNEVVTSDCTGATRIHFENFVGLLENLSGQHGFNPSLLLLKRDGSLMLGRRNGCGLLIDHRDPMSPARRYSTSERTSLPIASINNESDGFAIADADFRFLIDRTWLQKAL